MNLRCSENGPAADCNVQAGTRGKISASGRQSRIAPSELPIPSRAVKYSSHAFAFASIWVHHLPSSSRN